MRARRDAAKLQRSVGLGAYTFDCHWVSLYVDGAQIAAEGRVNQNSEGKDVPGVAQAPFQIPYDTMLPKRAELRNVLVPVAPSASHVRQNAIRMEPTWMIMGHAAGTAAAMAAKAGSAVQDVDVPALQAQLLAQKQKIVP